MVENERRDRSLIPLIYNLCDNHHVINNSAKINLELIKNLLKLRWVLNDMVEETQEKPIHESLTKIAFPFLNKRWPKGIECPLCHSMDMRVSDKVFKFPEYQPESGPVKVFPFVLIVCNNCGYAIPISLIYMERYLEQNQLTLENKGDKK
jgi:hypothetical protein